MKKLFRILLMAGLVMPFAACSDDDEITSVGQGDSHIVRIESSNSTVTTSKALVSVEKQITLAKDAAGSVTKLRLVPMSKQDACAAFGLQGSSVSIIPEGSYAVASGQSIVIDEGVSSVNVSVKFFPAIIDGATPDATGNTWILPLKLVSSTNSIDEQKSSILFNIELLDPLVYSFDLMDEVTDVEITYLEKEVPLNITVEAGSSAYSASLDSSDNSNLVAEYNSDNNTTFETLPNSAFELGAYRIGAGVTSVEGTLKLKRNGLTSNVEYLLPLKLTADNSNGITEEYVKFIKVTNPKYLIEDVDTSKWKILFANSEDGWGNADGYFAAFGIFDRIINRGWGSKWSPNNEAPVTAESSNDKDDLVYDGNGRFMYSPYFHYRCQGKRSAKDMNIVIDMIEPMMLWSVGLSKEPSAWGDRTLRSCDISLSSDFKLKTIKNDGGTMADYIDLKNEPYGWHGVTSTGIIEDKRFVFWQKFSDTPEMDGKANQSGKVLRLYNFTSYNVNLSWMTDAERAALDDEGKKQMTSAIGFGELYAKKIVAIDGVKVTFNE